MRILNSFSSLVLDSRQDGSRVSDTEPATAFPSQLDGADRMPLPASLPDPPNTSATQPPVLDAPNQALLDSLQAQISQGTLQHESINHMLQQSGWMLLRQAPTVYAIGRDEALGARPGVDMDRSSPFEDNDLQQQQQQQQQLDSQLGANGKVHIRLYFKHRTDILKKGFRPGWKQRFFAPRPDGYRTPSHGPSFSPITTASVTERGDSEPISPQSIAQYEHLQSESEVENNPDDHEREVPGSHPPGTIPMHSQQPMLFQHPELRTELEREVPYWRSPSSAPSHSRDDLQQHPEANPEAEGTVSETRQPSTAPIHSQHNDLQQHPEPEPEAEGVVSRSRPPSTAPIHNQQNGLQQHTEPNPEAEGRVPNSRPPSTAPIHSQQNELQQHPELRIEDGLAVPEDDPPALPINPLGMSELVHAIGRSLSHADEDDDDEISQALLLLFQLAVICPALADLMTANLNGTPTATEAKHFQLFSWYAISQTKSEDQFPGWYRVLTPRNRERLVYNDPLQVDHPRDILEDLKSGQKHWNNLLLMQVREAYRKAHPQDDAAEQNISKNRAQITRLVSKCIKDQRPFQRGVTNRVIQLCAQQAARDTFVHHLFEKMVGDEADGTTARYFDLYVEYATEEVKKPGSRKDWFQDVAPSNMAKDKRKASGTSTTKIPAKKRARNSEGPSKRRKIAQVDGGASSSGSGDQMILGSGSQATGGSGDQTTQGRGDQTVQSSGDQTIQGSNSQPEKAPAVPTASASAPYQLRNKIPKRPHPME
ncbi:MAG: hypothetical protein Q9168_004914 [Polycauliona sp. 1 TL-2023]